MKVIKKGKTKLDRALAAAQKFSSRVVCDECGSTLAFNANDLRTFAVPGYVKVVCPVCKQYVPVDEGGLPKDILNYVGFVANQALKPVEIVTKEV